MKPQNALISVSNKDGLEEFTQCLVDHNVKIFSTGGTYKYLQDLGITVAEVSDYLGVPEMLDGRVKTLNYKIHAGILADRSNPAHIKQLSDDNILSIDILCVNFYDFENHKDIEHIDIGGPTMCRAAAKNFAHVCVVSDCSQYEKFIAHFSENGGDTSVEFRRECAREVFRETAVYDAEIAEFLGDAFDLESEKNLVICKNGSKLRYGENPHQSASLYSASHASRSPSYEQIQGKELSYNNILDMSCAWDLVREFKDLTVAIIKHNNPCGIASSDTLVDAYKKALLCDSMSAFGGVVACNEEVDAHLANEVIKIFTEVIIARNFTDEALQKFREKKNLRVILCTFYDDFVQFKSVFDSFLIQKKDDFSPEKDKLTCVTERNPGDSEMKNLIFAYKICKYAKSNAIVIANDFQTIGLGIGQTSRVASAKIALEMAEKSELLRDASVLASDGFFPFKDNIELAAKYGIKNIIQPGGSVKDGEIIKCANDHGISMIFTHNRCFRH